MICTQMCETILVSLVTGLCLGLSRSWVFVWLHMVCLLTVLFHSGHYLQAILVYDAKFSSKDTSNSISFNYTTSPWSSWAGTFAYFPVLHLQILLSFHLIIISFLICQLGYSDKYCNNSNQGTMHLNHQFPICSFPWNLMCGIEALCA